MNVVPLLNLFWTTLYTLGVYLCILGLFIVFVACFGKQSEFFMGGCQAHEEESFNSFGHRLGGFWSIGNLVETLCLFSLCHASL